MARLTARRSRLRLSARVSHRLVLAVTTTVGVTHVSHAVADTYSMLGPNSSAWLTATNWQDLATATTGAVPGSGDVAQFDVNPTAATAASGFGINFTGSTNNGTANQIVGTVEVTSGRTKALYLGATVNNKSGVLTLSGATINGQANTILANLSSGGTLNIVSFVQSNTSSFMGLVLANTPNIVQLASSGSSAIGNYINITDNITEKTAGSNLTVLGGGNATLGGGVLELGGTNSFTGAMTVGDAPASGVTSQSAAIQFDGAAALPTTGNITVNLNSGIIFNSGTASTYGSPTQTLNISGSGVTGALGVIRTLGSAASTYQGIVNFTGAGTIDPAAGNSSLVLSGTVLDNGFALTKTGQSPMTLSGTNNVMTGSTLIQNGMMIVASGSSMGTGNVTLTNSSAASASQATTLNLNNSAQMIGNLSNSFGSAGTAGFTQAAVVSLGNTTLTVNQADTTNFGNGTLVTQTGAITGQGNLVLSAASTGTLTLSGTNTYSGSTTILGGTLQLIRTVTASATGGALTGGGPVTVNGGMMQINANTSITGGGTITVNSGTFGGGGSFDGPITVNNGLIFEGGPTGAVGSLKASNNFTLTSGATLKIKATNPSGANGTAVEGVDADTVMLSGNNQTFTVGGAALQLTLLGSANFSGVSLPVTYRIVDATNGTGNTINFSKPFAGLAPGQVFSDGTGISYSINYSSSEIDLVISAAPEPATLSTIGLIGGGLLLRRRRSLQTAPKQAIA